MHPDPTLVAPIAYTGWLVPLILLHAGAGGLALLTSLVAIATRKGGRAHRRAGRAFTAAMVGVGLSAFVVAVIRPNPFLFTVGVFSLYLSLSGWLAARGPIGRAGVALAATMVLAGAVMTLGGLAAMAGLPPARAWLAGAGPMVLTFGVIGALRASKDLRAARPGAESRDARIIRHLGQMLAASVAAWTALAVVNDAGRLPVYLVWFGPTLIGAPLIAWWSRRLTSARRPAPVPSPPCVPSISSTVPT